jgi:hypothetical protein
MAPSTGFSISIGRALEIVLRVVSKVKLFEFGVVGTTHITPITSSKVAAIAANSRTSNARIRANGVSEAIALLFQRLFDFGPSIFKRDGAIKNEGIWFRIEIQAKVSQPFKLKAVQRLCVLEARFDLT